MLKKKCKNEITSYNYITDILTIYQATLIGGGGSILKYPPQKNLPKISLLKILGIFFENQRNYAFWRK